MMSSYTDRAFGSLYIDRIKSRYAYYLKVLRLEFLHIPARFVSRVKNLEAKDMTVDKMFQRKCLLFVWTKKCVFYLDPPNVYIS